MEHYDYDIDEAMLVSIKEDVFRHLDDNIAMQRSEKFCIEQESKLLKLK